MVMVKVILQYGTKFEQVVKDTAQAMQLIGQLKQGREILSYSIERLK